MSVLLIIYSCKKYSFLHQDYIKKYTELGYDVFIVYGVPTIEEQYLINFNENIIKLRCKDNFEDLPFKTYALLKMFLNEEKFQKYDFLIKMDDDTELNIHHDVFVKSPLFENNYFGQQLIKSQPMLHNYHFGKCFSNELNSKLYDLEINLEWGAGFFYVLSRNAINLIVGDIRGYSDLLNENLYEDMMIGYIMSNNNIEFVEMNNKNIITNLPRPRILSIQINSNNTKVYTNISNINKIKKITYNYGNDEDIDNKIQREIEINSDINNKLEELTKKINDINKLNNSTINNSSINNSSINNSSINNSSINNPSSQSNTSAIKKNNVVQRNIQKSNTAKIIKVRK